MRVEEIMSTSVQTIGSGEAAEAAAAQMRLHRIHHLVVMDGKKPSGVISDRDLGGRRVGEAVRKGHTVGELMTSAPITISPTATIREAANLMRGRTIGCLPIVSRGKLLGIITVTDLLELIGRGVTRPVEQGKRWTLKHRGSHRQPASVSTALDIR